MRKISNLVFCISFCLTVSFLTDTGVAFASQNIEDDCLACHSSGSTIVPNTKQFEKGTSWHDSHNDFTCTLCHPGSPGATPIPVANCQNCHDTTCAWQDSHERNQTYLDNVVGFTCAQCHQQCAQSGDADGDGIPDSGDNCPDTDNPGQEDTYPSQGNGIGDACDCEGDFNCDGDVDAFDIDTFLTNFGRNSYVNPCVSVNPCTGDFSCDGDVDADDIVTLLEDFGRGKYDRPCPQCSGEAWCSY